MKKRSINIGTLLLISAIGLVASCDFNSRSEREPPTQDGVQTQQKQTQQKQQSKQDSHERLSEYRKRIQESQLTIYDSLDGSPKLLIPITDLEAILRSSLQGMLLDFPIRTRSKYVKSAICEAIGYPVPKSFRKTQPRFPGQDFDVYVQKSNNLQIWNLSLIHI